MSSKAVASPLCSTDDRELGDDCQTLSLARHLGQTNTVDVLLGAGLGQTLPLRAKITKGAKRGHPGHSAPTLPTSEIGPKQTSIERWNSIVR